MKKMVAEQISAIEAMDYLSSIADLDLEGLHKVQGRMKWLDVQNEEGVVHQVRQILGALYQSLKDLAKESKNKEAQKGAKSLILLLEEGAWKLDQYLHRWGKGTLKQFRTKELVEYQNLIELYQKKFGKKEERTKEEELWREEWELSQSEVEEEGIKDLEAIKNDEQYELLYIKKEDGRRFIHRPLLRHIKLLNDFERLLTKGHHDDPFLLVHKVLDKEALASAKEIKEAIASHLQTFFEHHKEGVSSEFYLRISYAIYALMLASSHNNLVEKGGRKNCFCYFQDFCSSLREAFCSTDYYACAEEGLVQANQWMEDLLVLCYELTFQFFTHIGAKDQMIGLIQILMNRKGRHETKKRAECKVLWTEFLEGEKHLNDVLKLYPNGPLFKTLDGILEHADEPFDPLAQDNYPKLLYSFHNEEFKVKMLRVPSPTRQDTIDKAVVSPLFEGFLRGLKVLGQHESFLMINLQDRTSWQEHARCQVLEALRKQAHLAGIVEVCTLPKNTIFYHQSDEYHDTLKAKEFIGMVEQQIVSGEECGFYFPSSISEVHLQDFVRSCATLIHEHFFGGKASLSHKNRCDFIEILYFFLILKIIDLIKPTYMSLTCKDAIDISAATYGGFFAFIKLISPDDIWSREEEDFLLWMLQSSALLYRERGMHTSRYERTINALEVMDAQLQVNKSKIVKDFASLYGYAVFKNLGIREG